MTFGELESQMMWPDFHDSSLIKMEFIFLDRDSLVYTPAISMHIVGGMKIDEGETSRIFVLMFSDVKNIRIDATMDDDRLEDSSDVYSLTSVNQICRLETAKGWILTFEYQDLSITQTE